MSCGRWGWAVRCLCVAASLGRVWMSPTSRGGVLAQLQQAGLQMQMRKVVDTRLERRNENADANVADMRLERVRHIL